MVRVRTAFCLPPNPHHTPRRRPLGCCSYHTYGPIWRASLFGDEYVVVANVDVIRSLTREGCVQLHIPGNSMVALLPDMEYLYHSDWHKFFRRVTSLSLNAPALAGYCPQMRAIVERHVARWQQDGGFNIFEAVRCLRRGRILKSGAVVIRY